MKIYKLSSLTEKEAKDFICQICEIRKWVQYASNIDNGIHNCVYLGKLVKENAQYDEEGNVVTEPVYYDNYAFDIMAENIDIPDHITEEIPTNPAHSFA